MPGDPQKSQLTVEEKICFHLMSYHHLRHEFVLPEEIAQNGIAAAVRVNRGHASVALISLKGKDLVEERVSRVQGSPRRKKVYFLTEHGLDEGEKIENLVESIATTNADDFQPPPSPLHAESKEPIEDPIFTNGTSPHIRELSTYAPDHADFARNDVGDDHRNRIRGKEIEDGSDSSRVIHTWPSSLPSRKPSSLDLYLLSPILGISLSVFALILLWVAVESNSTTALILSYLFLIPGFFILNIPTYLRSQTDEEVIITQRELFLTILSLIVLTISLRITIDDEIFGEEIGQVFLVIVPLMIILSLRKVVPHPLDIMIAGLAGAMIILYGTSQSLLALLPGSLNYPMLWVFGGFMVYALGFFRSLPKDQRYISFSSSPPPKSSQPQLSEVIQKEDGGDRSTEEMQKDASLDSRQFDPLLMSTDWGIGAYILLTLLAIRSDLDFDGTSAFLPILWMIFGLLLILLGTVQETRDRMPAILLSSLIFLVGAIFFYAAGIFLSLGKYIEGMVEIMVGALLIRFGSTYLSPEKWHLIYTSVTMAVGLLSVHQLYINL